MRITPKLHAKFWFEIVVVLAASNFLLHNKVHKGELLEVSYKGENKAMHGLENGEQGLFSYGHHWFSKNYNIL